MMRHSLHCNQAQLQASEKEREGLAEALRTAETRIEASHAQHCVQRKTLHPQ